MKYKNEAAFSKALVSKLNKAGLDVTRIESHSTVRGIPDIFVQGFGFDAWLELKNGNSDWRPGQLGWCYTYFLKHDKKKCVLTLRSVDEGIIFYPMINDTRTELNGILVKYKDLSPMVLASVIKTLTHIEKCTLREFCITASSVFHVDYDPDAYWEQEQLEQQVNQWDKVTVLLGCVELRKNEP